MDSKVIGRAGLTGWRSRLADAIATPVSRRSPLSEDDVRAAVGVAFLVLSLVYVTGSVRRFARNV